MGSPATFSRSVGVSVSTENQCCNRISAVCAVRKGAKSIKVLQGSLSCHPVNRAGAEECAQGNAQECAPIVGDTVEVSIGFLDEWTKWEVSVRTVRPRAKAVEGCQLAVSGYLEERTAAVSATERSCPIKVPIRALDQTCEGFLAVGAVDLGAKVIKSSHCPSA